MIRDSNGEEVMNKTSIGKTRISLKAESFFRLIANERNQSAAKLRSLFLFFLSFVLFRGKKTWHSLEREHVANGDTVGEQ